MIIGMDCRKFRVNFLSVEQSYIHVSGFVLMHLALVSSGISRYIHVLPGRHSPDVAAFESLQLFLIV